MCGIVGYIGPQTATDVLMAGLERLEYRGYDSAGMATVWDDRLHCVRAKGKLHNLRQKLEREPMPAQLGIGHTRWATHGKPEEHNAHPHLDGNQRIAVVQNGIVENHRPLREELAQKGHAFASDTDTEVVPHLIAECLEQADGESDGRSRLFEAVRKALSRLQGAFAIAVVCADYPDELIVAREQAPLAIGFGQGEFFCASDTPALIPHTNAVLPLENGEMARLTPLGAEIYTLAGERLQKKPRTLDWNPVLVEKQGFRHFMLKEIHEQPGVVRACLEAYLNDDWTPETYAAASPIDLGLPAQLYQDLEAVEIVACGTSWHAGLIGKYLLEQLAGIPTAVHYASEFRYAPTPLKANTLTVGVTQSGETADTLAALNLERERRAQAPPAQQARLLGMTNRPESTLARSVDAIIDTHAGIEIGVAATKTFMAQVVGFCCLALELAARRQALPPDRLQQMVDGLRQLPAQIELVLESREEAIEALAHEFKETRDFIFIGRGINFPIALEGALKLKEISYLHAEGYPAGEMKHGPIALLDDNVPVVAVAMPGQVYDKVISNAEEAKARDAHLIGVTALEDTEASATFDQLLPVPGVDEWLSPFLSVVPLQLLSYYIAARRGLDVDQPRNLAKSVTVE
ncbi:MAG: glutamine--fructose-6-phosphate transaminase (isomerizing) [Cyanobacteria bacterium QS_8_64_29]|nr:MAG: glutamine--fructose-6-phosphate transaminase (isomerizing) [Cyanobacteria bacterium QS_8_64_29]